MKRLIKAAIVLIIGACLIMGAFAVSYDFDSDGECGIKDVLIIINSMLNGDATEAMDINGDGKVGLLDVIKVLRKAVAGEEEIADPTFVVADVTASPGDASVSIPISIVKNPGILGMTLVVSYDESVMTLVNSANGDALSMLTFTKPKNYKSGSIFTWYGEALSDDEIADGGVLTLTFDISESAANGTYPVSVSYTEGDIFDANLEPVKIAVVNGSCSIIGSSEGGEGGSGNEGGEGGETEEITSPTFVVGDTAAAAGDTEVSIPVSIVKNPGILGMTLVVSYDDSVMTLVNSANGDALSMLTFTKPKRYKSGSIFTWYGEALSDDEIADGGVLTLTFDISESAASGTYPVSISYTDGDIFDADLAPVEIAIKNGNITVAE